MLIDIFFSNPLTFHSKCDKIIQLIEQALLAQLDRVTGYEPRIKILFALSESEMCVCAIAELLGMNQSAISHQLRTLKDANLVASRREGKTIYYHLSDDHVRTIIGQGFEHLTEKH